ncbi:S-layer homology domain-containing protein [Paenibacillus sp. MSJ-34]|uniref:S-layer homology domain-containing protein n=1 Tax=Paenibacillus sp. MSJ-34 TaxID=2841529 RepID=UPI001C1102FC|nr:S-layer homology domain-containing protein [Paenibacillus sp. MSJ-34]MBU5444757.1 S-layer homology domain-containing protein [Paenibacillus sp. MSJ-34]
MLKNAFQKWTSAVLFICVMITTIIPTAAAYGAEEGGGAGSLSLEIAQSQVNGEYALNLSEVGNVDWLHLKGDGAGNVIQIKKAGSNSVTFSVYGETAVEGKPNRGGDANYISYSWSDGMPGYETGVKDTGFGVFFPERSRDAGPYENVGWDFTVAPQPQDTTIVFGLGMWNAKIDLNFYAEDSLVETKQISAGGTSQVYQYQMKVPAHVSVKVEGRQTETIAKYGNITFSGLAVGTGEVVDKLPLRNEYNAVKDMVQRLYTDESWQAFVAAREQAKTILEKADATQIEADNALRDLRQAKAALVKRETNIMVDYTGSWKGNYAFGNVKDQRDRYQTFTPKESFEMEYVQVRVMPEYGANDLIVALYAVNDGGIPEGAPLAQAVVDSAAVASDGLTTAKLSYSLEQNQRYAIILSQTNPVNGKYQWVVTNKTEDSENEYFGKTVFANGSARFVPEAHLGTGILRIVKKSNLDKSSLEALIEELSRYNRKFYTAQSWSALETELARAKEVLHDFDAEQTEIDAAFSALQAAFDNLSVSGGLDGFAEQIAAIEGAVVKGYTEESVYTLKLAVEAAKSLGTDASEQEKLQAYSNVLNTLDRLQVSGKYQYETNRKMTAAFGFEGDKNASLAFLDGSYQIGGARPQQHGPVAPMQMVTFGVTDTDHISWYKAEGYLPVFVSEYTKDDVKYKIESFGNKHTVEGKDYVIDYSRVTATNLSGEKRLLPVVSGNLIPLNEHANRTFVMEAGETVVRDYAIEADKYEYFDEGVTKFTSLTSDQVASQGSFDDNYQSMKTYWVNRLSALVSIDLPNKELVNAFKAGYIDMMIIKDGTYLHVGENGYARLYSHDTLGILVQLLQSGDFQYAKQYLESIPLTGGINIETGEIDGNLYWDANWKLAWAYAVYVSKTGDIGIFDEQMTADDGSRGTIFEKRVKYAARSIADDRKENADGIMKQTYAIDDKGYWTIDNHSALMGLTAYEYIGRELYKATNDERYMLEAQWAKAEYNDLLEKFTARLQKTIDDKKLDYIPISVVQSNDENRTKDSRDANWASMFLFGRWTWDGYLYGAEQPEDNINISMLDQTYTYGINRRINEGTTDSPYNFGGYPHGFYSSAYNAGYGSAALRGEQYRDMGIKAYEFMLERSMSGPFSWWEGIDYPKQKTPWAKTNDRLSVHNTPGGGGSAPHMWGQSVNSKVLIDALIAERIYNQNRNYDIIVGRGIPKEWVENAADNANVVAEVNNYPAFQGGRVGYKIVKDGNKLIVTFHSDLNGAKVGSEAERQFSIQLPSMVNNIAAASAGTVDGAKGIVSVPIDTPKVTITLGDSAQPGDKQELQLAYDQVKDLEQGTYTDSSWTEFVGARANAKAVLDKDGATAAEIEAALAALREAIDRLEQSAKPVWPQGSKVTYSNVGTSGLTLHWTPAADAKGIAQYSIVWGERNLTVKGDVHTVRITGLTAGTQYTFKVEALNEDGLWSDNGPSVTVKTNSSGGGGNSGGGQTGGLDQGSSGNSGEKPGDTKEEGDNGSEEGQDPGKDGGTPHQPGDKPAPGEKLKDIAGHWAAEAIRKAAELGIVTGYEDGTFRPNHHVTRGEFTAMLGRALKWRGDHAVVAFADKERIPAWAQAFVAEAVGAGVVKGYEDNTFRPDKTINRTELAVMIARAAGLATDPKAELSFADADRIPAWARPYIAAAVDAGLVKGRGNNLFVPNDNASRAEAVTLILSLLEYK